MKFWVRGTWRFYAMAWINVWNELHLLPTLVFRNVPGHTERFDLSLTIGWLHLRAQVGAARGKA